MSEEVISQLTAMPDTELWNLFSDLHQDESIEDNVYYDVLIGTHGTAKFPFPFWLKYNDDTNRADKWIMDRPNRGTVRIGKKEYHILTVILELERRRRLMRQNIRDALQDRPENETVGRYG